MNKAFWPGREHAAAEMARGAASEQARLIHLELARRYRIEAIRSGATADTDPGAKHGPGADQPSPPAPSVRPRSIFRPLPPADLPVDPNGRAR